jgi:hypothetical protein
MHPVILELLAAEHVQAMITKADDAQRVRQARRARRVRPAPARPRPGGHPAAEGATYHPARSTSP